MNKADSLTHLLNVVLTITGGFSAALGALVLVGWHTHNIALIQVRPAFAPMQYNTALGFLFCGAGLLAIVSDRLRLAMAGGIIVAVLGLLTLVEYIAGIDLSLDQLLMTSEITVGTSHPGRIAPNTAVCFLLGGTALWIMSRRTRFRQRPLILGILGSMILAIGVAASFGYLSGVESAYGWGRLTRMAVHAALGVVELGIGVIAFAWRDGRVEKTRMSWLPLPFSIGVLTVTLCLWQALIVAETQSALPGVVLIGGFLMALMLALTIYLAQKASRRAKEVELVNRNLQEEITERKQAEERLRHVIYGARCLLWHATVRRQWTDDHPEGNLAWDIHFSDEASAQKFIPLNVRPGETYDDAWYRSKLPADLPHMDETAETAILGGQSGYHQEFRCIDREGKLRWFYEDVQIEPVAENQWRLIGVCTDITEQKQSREEFDRFFTLSIDLFCIVDFDGYFKRLNPAWCKILGFTEEELLTRPLIEFVHPDDRESTLAEMKKLEMGRDTVGFENRYICKDGSHRWLLWSATPFVERKLIYAAARNITERVNIEQMKNEFIATVSHELRTPLTSIRGSLGLIAGGVAGELPQQARTMIDIALKNSERLVNLINDILDIEKIESGQMAFDFRPIELMPLVEQAIEANCAYGDQFNVNFVLTDAVPGDIKVNADSNRLMQVFANLLSNAAKFSPPDAEVAISVSRHDSAVRVSVTDHGSGIPKEFRPHVFDKFAQADASDTRRSGGSGLGLSICKAIIEKHGGWIDFKTETDVGTTFYFDLPEWREQQTPVEGLTQPRHRPRILICEDNRDVANLLKLILNQGGFDTDIAPHAAAARRLLAQNQYAAMTLDILLPDEDGISFIRELREQEPSHRLPVVVVSVKDEPIHYERLNGSGVTVLDWLQKPIDQARLLTAIKQAIRRSVETKLRILHIEDDRDIFEVVSQVLQNMAEIVHAANLQEAKQKLEAEPFDLVILDIFLPDGDGLSLLPILNHFTPPVPVVIFSAKEVDKEVAQQVNAVLIKSRTSNEKLIETIRSLIPGDNANLAER